MFIFDNLFHVTELEINRDQKISLFYSFYLCYLLLSKQIPFKTIDIIHSVRCSLLGSLVFYLKQQTAS